MTTRKSVSRKRCARTLEDFGDTRFYNHRIDEAFTLLGVEEIDGDPIYVEVQYDDGTPHDQAIADEPIADQFGWDPDGLLSAEIEPIGPGPTLEEACEVHDWFPQPDQLWESADQYDSDLYLQIARCRRCGLSGLTAMDHGQGR